MISLLLTLPATVWAQDSGKLMLVAGSGQGGAGIPSRGKIATPYGVGFDGKGNIVWTTPAKVVLDLPSGLSDDVAETPEPETRTF